MKTKNKLYYGIFLISLATLALEISLIRLFSIMQWYHFAFMVVSIALFGIAASGTFLAIKKIKNKNILFNSSLLFSLSVIIGFFILNKISFDPYKAILNFFALFKLLFYYILLGLPFFFFGIIIAYSFSKQQKKSGKIYFYNLFGSGLGTLLAIPLISFFNIKLIYIIAIIGLISSLFFIKNTKIKFLNINKKLIIYFLIIILITLLFVPSKINISQYKELNLALNFPNSKLLSTKYNSFSRVDIVNSSFTRYAPGLSPSFRGNLPDQLGVLVDAGNMNSITNNRNPEFIDHLPNSIGYSLIKKPKVLIINSGAGLDVLSALHYNSTVTALETNPIIINLLKTKYKDFSGNIYNKADIYLEEGRSFIKRKEKYDIIILSLAGNVLSSSAGLTSLSENYLLTVEAFEDYLNSLNENGILIITRFLLYPPRESLKLFSIALAIVDKENIAMFRSWTTITLLISKNKLNNNTIKKIKNFTNTNKFDIIYLPSDFTPNKYGKFKEPYYYNLINNLLKNKKEFQKNYLFNIAPTYDNKPFYFNFFKFSKFPLLYKIIGNKWQPFFDSGFLLFFILVQALILSLIFILSPLKFFKNIKIKKLSLIYFFCLGISYLFIEIVLIQKFILFLGHVIYSTTTIIFSLLLFSSFGAYFSNNLKTKKTKNIIILLFFIIILYSIFLPIILNKLIILNLIIKIILSIIIIAPLAFIMGMPFPLGIRIINKKLIPWSWAVNGVASVLSPILAILIALSFGYSFVLILSAFIYLVSVFALPPVMF